MSAFRRMLMAKLTKGRAVVESYIEGYTNAALHTIRYSLDGGNTYQGVTSDADAYFRIDLPSAPTTLEKLFYPGDDDERRENFAIVYVNFSHVADSSHVTNMAWMCKNLNELASVNLNGLQGAKPTDIGQIFNSCEALTALDMSMLDTSHVTASVTNHGFATMLYGCTALETVKLPQFPSTAYMGSSPFGMCSALTTISQCGTIATDKFHVNQSPLTRASALVIINALADKTGGTAGTLKLSASTLALLNQSDITIANGKNWNVTS